MSNPFKRVLFDYQVSASLSKTWDNPYTMDGQAGDLCLVLMICDREVDTSDFVEGTSPHKYVLEYLKSYGYSQLARIAEVDWSSHIERGQ